MRSKNKTLFELLKAHFIIYPTHPTRAQKTVGQRTTVYQRRDNDPTAYYLIFDGDISYLQRGDVQGGRRAI